MKRQLEVTEEQLEQVSEAFETLVGDRERREVEMEGRISELEEEVEGAEGKVRGLEREVEEGREREREEREVKERLEGEIRRKPNSLYKDVGGRGGGGEDVERWKREADALRRKCEGMSKDMKRLIKASADSKGREKEEKARRKDEKERREVSSGELSEALKETKGMRLPWRCANLLLVTLLSPLGSPCVQEGAGARPNAVGRDASPRDCPVRNVLGVRAPS